VRLSLLFERQDPLVQLCNEGLRDSASAADALPLASAARPAAA